VSCSQVALLPANCNPFNASHNSKHPKEKDGKEERKGPEKKKKLKKIKNKEKIKRHETMYKQDFKPQGN